MGIKFTCPACGRALNVKSELGGKKGRCPKCQAKIEIPAESAADSGSSGSQASSPSGLAPAPATGLPTASAATAAPGSTAAPRAAAGAGAVTSAEKSTILLTPQAAGVPGGVADPISEAPQMQWYALPPGAANQYGPAKGEEFRVWMQEGRITADALVWRQDWPDWKRAGSVFPKLEAAASVAAPVAAPAAGTPLPTATAARPMTAGSPPVAQPIFPVAAAGSGLFTTAGPIAPAVEGFPLTTAEPARTRGAAGRGYRPRSNTGPIIAIVVLLLAMIPLGIVVFNLVREQLGSSPPTKNAATSSNRADE